MSKIFLSIFLFFSFIIPVWGYEKPNIITREQWGANEEYVYSDSKEWQAKYKAWAEAKQKRKEAQAGKEPAKPTAYQEFLKKQRQQAEQIWVKHKSKDTQIVKKLEYFNERPLAWDITYTRNIRGIIIHHTETKGIDSGSTIRSIQKFHSLSRAWGDIGYNYLIGLDGKIYEGRLGGEKSVGAHTKWNNAGNIGISLMGSYNDKPISRAQEQALENLVGYLVEKYEIDLTKTVPYFQECFNPKKCKTPLIVRYLPPIITHRDTGATSCPGNELYAQAGALRTKLSRQQFLKEFDIEHYFSVFKKFSDYKLLDVLQKIEAILDKKYQPKAQGLKYLLLDYFDQKFSQTKKLVDKTRTDKNIKVKLSYPEDKQFIQVDDGEKVHTVAILKGDLYYDKKKVTTVDISVKKGEALTVTSWERVPAWDKLNRYNDNTFRGKLMISKEGEKLLVVNELPIEQYLKGLGEVSNSENLEKAKTIIVSARTYALWYVTEARKFPGKPYDASDDPNVFQKYLGYGLEQRSPRINSVVQATKGEVLMYNGKLIKTWYFNSSNGTTKSYYDYCIGNKNSLSQCRKEQNIYPFLIKKIDPGSLGKRFNGHGVGLSGNGTDYFAKRGWTYDMILRYFYNGTQVR